MAIVTGHKIGKEIADALGIKHCRKLDIRIRTDEIVTIEAEFFPEIDGIKQLEPIFKKYELVEKESLKDIAITEPPIGIDGEPINPMQEYKKFLITTGGKSSQFGIDEEKYRDFFSCLQGMNHCNYVGIHVFSGSQCLDEETVIENIAYILQIAKKVFNDTTIELKIINFGGGFGIPYYESEKELDIDYVCSNITRQFKKFKQETGLSRCIGILELGRYLVAEAGVYIARVIDLKESRGEKICVLSGGMNHNLLATIKFGRPMGENLKILNLSNVDSSVKQKVTLVGPLCTSFDVIGENVEINKPAIGHYIAIFNSGAYVYTASPLLFLSHDTPAELLLDEDGVKVIRKSYTVEMFNSKQ